MSEYPKSKGKKRYYSKHFKNSYNKNKSNDRTLEKAIQIFVDSLDAGNVRSDTIQIRSTKAKKNCSRFKIYKARVFSEGKSSYRVIFSIKKNSVFFLELHNKSKNYEANHDEIPICNSINVIKEKRCDDEFCIMTNPLVYIDKVLN